MTRTTIRSEDITAGQVKSADIASDAVDTSALRNDISTLALHSAIADNKAAFNLSNAFIDQFEDDTGIDTETNCDRNSSEYMSSVSTTSEAYHVNVNGVASENGQGSTPTFSTANDARTAYGANTGSSGFSLNSQSGKNSGIFTLEQTLVQLGNGGGPNMYGYGVMKNNSSMSAYTGNAYSAYPNGIRWNSSSSVGHKIKTVYDTDSPNVITVYADTGSGYGSGNTSLGSQGANFTDSLTTLHFFMVCWSDSSNDWIWDVSGTREYTVENASGNFTSTTQTAQSSVSKMGAIILYKNNAGTATLNSDLVVQLSADGGSNYTTATLEAGGTFSTGISIAKVNGLTIGTPGTAPKYKISFANQASGSKETQVHGVALLY